MRKDTNLLLLAITLYSMGRVAIFIFALTKADRIANPIIPTIMMAFYFAFSAIFGIFFGSLSDKVKKRNIFNIYGTTIAGVVYLFYFFVFDPILLIILHIFAGITFSASVPTSQALFSELEPEMERGRLMSYYNCISSVGWAIGSLVGGYIAEISGDFVFIFCSITTFCAGFVVFFVQDVPFENKVSNISNNPINHQSNFIDEDVKRILILIAVVLLFRHIASQGSIVSLLPNWLTRLGATPFESSIILSINMITQTIVMIPIGTLTDKVGRKIILGIGVACTGLAAFLYSLATNPWHVIPSQILIAISWSTLITSATAIVTDITERENRSTGMGYLTAGLAIGGTIGPLISGSLLYYLSNSLNCTISFGGLFDPLLNFLTNGNRVFILTFQLVSLFSILGILILLKLKEDKKKHQYSL